MGPNLGNKLLDACLEDGQDLWVLPLAASSQPWDAEPGRLWSLLDMLQYTARLFFWCGGALQNIRGDCYIASMVCSGEEPGIDLRRTVDESAINKAATGLRQVERSCREIGMLITADMAKDLIDQLDDEITRKRSFEWLHTSVAAIERLAEKELKSRVFLYIQPDRQKYWPTVDQPNLFGADVEAKFKSSSSELFSAGQSLAIGMGTAAVFHLMRVTEVGLRAFCGHLGFTEVIEKYDRSGLGQHEYRPIEYAVWEKILGQLKDKVAAKIDSFSDRHEKQLAQEYYVPILQEIWAIKEAWRNHVMHARRDYTPEDAIAIMAHVKRLMVRLSERVQEA